MDRQNQGNPAQEAPATPQSPWVARERARLCQGCEARTQQRGAGPLIDKKHNKVTQVPLRYPFSFHNENLFHS